jgi:hypothetical protein
MQVSALQAAPQGNNIHHNYNMDAMDMDIDMDIDIGIDAEDFMEPESVWIFEADLPLRTV